ncbi:MAG: bifunctional diaminohydroxyphosphoribosylaminopyrimidine deaminase/5-amino-6-(5-phosphoribosylamino)uracil reductase RibD [Rickettsiales bacterium]
MRRDDAYFMELADALGRAAAGDAAENPAVGCVIVKDGVVVGYGATAKGGRPHAEIEALLCAGALVEGSNVYVTLEPCSHFGKSPPCASALIKAKPARVIYAALDPDVRVSGRGVAALRDAGIRVERMPFAPIPKGAEGFLLRRRTGLPHVTLKIAASTDGKTACASGDSRWITGDRARDFVHRLRAESDAVMIGGETARRDDPRLDCRLPGLQNRSPLRVILNANADAITESSFSVHSSATPTWIMKRPDAIPPSFAKKFPHLRYVSCPEIREGALDVKAACEILAENGVNRLLVEAGGRLAAEFLRYHLWNDIYWFTAPVFVGSDGKSAYATPSPFLMAEARRLSLAKTLSFYPDFSFIFKNCV